MSTEQIYSFFTASKNGKTGLSPTVDIFQIVRTTGATTQIVTNGSMSVIGGGGYRYTLSNVDLLNNDYLYIAKTTDTTVDQQQLPGLITLSNSRIVDASLDNPLYLLLFNASSDINIVREYFTGENGYIAADIANTLSGVTTLLKLGKNKVITNPLDHTFKVYDDDGVTILLSGLLYEDADAQTPYRGQGISRREMLQ